MSSENIKHLVSEKLTYSLRLDVRGEWLITPENQYDRWDIENVGQGMCINADSASDSSCNYKPKTCAIIKPDKNMIYVHSGRVPKSAHPKEIWGEVSITIGLVTDTSIANILFIPPTTDLSVDTCIGLAYPEKDDSIRFEEKRLYGFGEHLHGPFNKQRVYGIKIRLSDNEPLLEQIRERGKINTKHILPEFYNKSYWVNSGYLP